MYKDLSLAASRWNIFFKVEEEDERLQLGAAYAQRVASVRHSRNVVLFDISRFMPFT